MDCSFRSWLRRRQSSLNDLMPAADKIVPLVARAGMTGVTRQQLGHALDLERDTLDELLAGLVRLGMLTVTDGIRGQVFHIGNGG